MSKKETIKEEEDWKCERDAQTLIEYQKLFNDEKRMKRAKEELKKRREEITQAMK